MALNGGPLLETSHPEGWVPFMLTEAGRGSTRTASQSLTPLDRSASSGITSSRWARVLCPFLKAHQDALPKGLGASQTSNISQVINSLGNSMG